MKNLHRFRWLMFFIALMMISGACSPVNQPLESEEEEVINGRLVLVDPESSAPGSYLPEYPSAGDESVLQEIPRAEGSSEPEVAVYASQSGQQVNASSASADSAPPPPSQSSASSAASPQAVSAPKEPSVIQAQSVSESSVASHVVGSLPRRVSLNGEVRSIWLSYLDLDGLLRGKSKSQFTANIRAVFDNCQNYGLNTVTVHVRPFADALYQSEYFPWSYICTGTEGVDPGFDPLAIMVDEAHARGLRIEAWLNPYRIRAAGSKNALSADNQAKIWLNAGDSAVISYNGVTSYNPASSKARELIANGAREIVQNYDVDGIHIDDYFYPTTDAAFDAASYREYKNGGGSLSLADWRRQNVETMIKVIYAAVKEENPNVLFGISPQSSVANNYNAMYLDVAKISNNAGYCDYICPQIYFGYQNAAQPYQETLEAWNKMVNTNVVDLYIGLAVYKSGVVDTWAGTGKNEWLQNTDIIKRMVESAREQSAYGGFILYRYDSLFNPESQVKKYIDEEYQNLETILYD